MSERYKLEFIEYESYYVDTEQEFVDMDDILEFNNLISMSDEQVVDVLNKQNETINLLHEELRRMWVEIMMRSPVGGWQEVIHESKVRIGVIDE